MCTKKAYTKGIVVMKCDGCQGLHLIADNLGWFGDKTFNIEEYMKENNKEFSRIQVDGLFSLGESENKIKN